MSENQDMHPDESSGQRSLVFMSRELVRELHSLSGMDALNNILDRKNPGQLIQGMTRVDLFWLVKKIGEDDSIPLLRFATDEQWVHFIDMEIWAGEHIDLSPTLIWLERLFKADPERLITWLYEDGHLLANYFFCKILQVETKTDEDQIFPEDFFTLDGTFYIRILDKEHEDVIGRMLRHMAQKDLNRYQALLLSLADVVFADVEEEMYRIKGVRLAEVGYLPYEEAVSVYSYQKADLLKPEESSYQLFTPIDDEAKALVPIMPLSHTQGDNLLTQSIGRIKDSLFIDRLRLEFAGLRIKFYQQIACQCMI